MYPPSITIIIKYLFIFKFFGSYNMPPWTLSTPSSCTKYYKKGQLIQCF